jgi:hypothetical protein
MAWFSSLSSFDQSSLTVITLSMGREKTEDMEDFPEIQILKLRR